MQMKQFITYLLPATEEGTLRAGFTVFVRWGKISANMVICDYSKVTKLDHFSLADNIGAY